MIPKLIHYCWFGGGPMSTLNQRCIDSWRRYCPDYEIRLWNEDNSDLSNAYCQAAINQKKWAFVSDWVRFDILRRHGGVYLDTDMELIAPLDGVLQAPGFVTACESGVAAGAGFLACGAGDPIMELSCRIIEDELIPQQVFTSSPLVLMEALARDPAPPRTLLPPSTFYPFNPYDKGNPRNAGQLMYADILPDTVAIHHYGLAASWTNRGWKKKINRLRSLLHVRARWDVSFAVFAAHRD